MLIRSDVDQNLLSKFTNTTSDSRISDQHLRSKRTGSLNSIVFSIEYSWNHKNKQWGNFSTHRKDIFDYLTIHQISKVTLVNKYAHITTALNITQILYNSIWEYQEPMLQFFALFFKKQPAVKGRNIRHK